MYELLVARGNTSYIKSPANIGVYKLPNNDVVLIDSGNDKEAAKKILRHVEENRWRISLIINTHSNADHCGGNAYLQEKAQCRIAATSTEAAFIENPLLEPSFLFGGFPPYPVQNKFLMATPSKVTDIIIPGSILSTSLQAIALPGHFMDMVGIVTPDKVFFLADSVFSKEVIEKYHITFVYDVALFLKTLSIVENSEAELFIPSHGEPTSSIGPLVQINRNKIFEIVDLILNNCVEPITSENLLKKIFDYYRLTMDFNQYVLVGSSIRSYLSYLYNINQVQVLFDQNVLFWKRT